ncbi:integrase_H2C2 domain-containing protein [Trichonephila clavipes]|nr:integrase_H2C2 domain-containing protein [Trichonephila clavipes]
MVKVSDHGRHVMSSSPVPLKTRRVGQRFMLSLSKAQTSSRWRLNLQITAVHFWSDSTIVISWIHRESRELKTFVANRVSKIHQLSSCDQWHHIASEQNPADVLSRGLFPEELRDDSLWWHGPELLQSTYSTTIIAEPTQRDDFDCELRVSERTLETSLLNSKNFLTFSTIL